MTQNVVNNLPNRYAAVSRPGGQTCDFLIASDIKIVAFPYHPVSYWANEKTKTICGKEHFFVHPYWSMPGTDLA